MEGGGGGGGGQRKDWMISYRCLLLPYSQRPSWRLQVGLGEVGGHVRVEGDQWLVCSVTPSACWWTNESWYAGELGENGGPLVMIRGVNI